MREIKFRGLSNQGIWIYGDLIQYQDGDTCAILEGFSKYGYEAKEINKRTNVKAKSIGQYTRLKDKNGKEIYEGDIYKNTWGGYSIVEPIVQDGRVITGFNTSEREIITGYRLDCVPEELEIIGNIHENPELLKEC